MDKIKTKEVIIVEGRDDIDAVSKACDSLLIATHGFGITKETWALIEKAYNSCTGSFSCFEVIHEIMKSKASINNIFHD